jgi:hypothetical protein
MCFISFNCGHTEVLNSVPRGSGLLFSKLSECIPKVGFNIPRLNENIRSLMLQLEAKGEKLHNIE